VADDADAVDRGRAQANLVQQLLHPWVDHGRP
jgi:hypothetical protein